MDGFTAKDNKNFWAAETALEAHAWETAAAYIEAQRHHGGMLPSRAAQQARVYNAATKSAAPKRFRITITDDQGNVLDAFRCVHYRNDHAEDHGGDDDEYYGSPASQAVLAERIFATVKSALPADIKVQK